MARTIPKTPIPVRKTYSEHVADMKKVQLKDSPKSHADKWVDANLKTSPFWL